MKKFYVASALVMGLSVSGIASAVPNTFTSNEVVAVTAAGETQAAGECALLSAEVTLGASANVIGAWQCNETSGVIIVAACHTGGSRATGVACSSDADLSTPAWDAPNAGCTTNSGNSTIPSFKAFYAGSGGGSMGEASMDTRCTSANITGLTIW